MPVEECRVEIEFRASERNTLGVEWELQLVDVTSRELRPEASAVIAALPGTAGRCDHPKVKHELMESTVELVTGICETVDDAMADLAASVAELRGVVEPKGLGLACSGTHPVSDWREAVRSPGERYADLHQRLQWLADQIQTFGVHIHVGVTDREKMIPVVNALADYLPHFLALTASSPFWVGRDTGLASSRAVVFGSLPTAGPPALLDDWGEFERYMATLLRAGAIQSIKEVWWDVRPHPDFGTVELRMCDGTPTAREVAMVAALAQALVRQFEAQLDRGYSLPRPAAWVVKENKWRATRYGLDAEVITSPTGSTRPLREWVAELASDLVPLAQRLRCGEHLATVDEVLARGASYERQRAVVADGGTPVDVVGSLLAEFRTDVPGAR